MYLDNKYTKWYNKIVENARARLTVPSGAEKHHVIPESFFINRTRKGPAGWLDGIGFVNWKAGDWFKWKGDVPHAASNIGNHNRWHGDRCRLNNSVTGEVPLQKS